MQRNIIRTVYIHVIKPLNTFSSERNLLNGHFNNAILQTSNVGIMFVTHNVLIKKNYFPKECASFRFAHTDIKIPDFSEYRNSYSKNPIQHTKDNTDDRKTYSYVSTFGKI
jgi:hypothetical protein